MPIQRAAFKSVRKDRKKRQRNLRITSELKTLAKKFEALVQEKKSKEAQDALRQLISCIDKAAAKKILHPNTASRKISRLMKHCKKLEASQ